MRILTPVLALALAGCSGAFPSSRSYQPTDEEASYLQRSLKTAMPTDVAGDPAAFEDDLLHWVGVVDSALVRVVGDSVFTEVVFEQHYYDYIEDFSIQTETMFVSPLGSGRFVYARGFSGVSADSVRQTLAVIAEPGNLGFVYGSLRDVRDDMPVLSDGFVRFLPEKVFSTAIFSYDVVRDGDGRVVATESEFPKLKDIRILKIAGPGQND